MYFFHSSFASWSHFGIIAQIAGKVYFECDRRVDNYLFKLISTCGSGDRAYNEWSKKVFCM